MAIDYVIGPNTAGLAQRIERKYAKQDEKENLYVLKKNYVLTCTTNQY